MLVLEKGRVSVDRRSAEILEQRVAEYRAPMKRGPAVCQEVSRAETSVPARSGLGL